MQADIPSPSVRGMPMPKTIPKAVLGIALAWVATVTGGLGCGAGARPGSDIVLPISNPGSGGCMSYHSLFVFQQLHLC